MTDLTLRLARALGDLRHAFASLEEGHRLAREATLQKLEDAFRGCYQGATKIEGPGRKRQKSPIKVEPAIGLEPMTCALRVRCSTTELRRLGHTAL